jgi:hypothetical protein
MHKNKMDELTEQEHKLEVQLQLKTDEVAEKENRGKFKKVPKEDPTLVKELEEKTMAFKGDFEKIDEGIKV